MKQLVSLISFLLVASMLPAAWAQDAAPSTEAATDTPTAPAETPAEAPAEAPVEALGLSIGLEFSSIYNFRGVNVFGGGNQNKQNTLIAPSFAWSIGDSGFSLGWWSGYQATGDNRGEAMDTGLGHEHDLVIGYSHGFYEDALVLSASLSAFLYPFANDNDAADPNRPGAGTRCPAYLEPLFGIDYNGPINLGLGLSYFAALQDAIKDYRYLYLNPHIGKTFQIRDFLAMRVNLSYGYKLFNDTDKMKDNVQDIRFDYEVPFTLFDTFSVAPNAHIAWTNFDALTIGEEYMVYGGVRLGYGF